MSYQAPERRFEFIHLLRGIAPILVIWAHLADWWPTAQGIHWAGQDIWTDYVVNPLRLSQFGGHLGVVIFFIISGFVITHASLRESRTEFFTRRLFRLAPMLVLSILLTVLAVRLSQYWGLPKPIGSETIKPLDIFLNITLLSWFIGTPWVLSVAWTLLIEVAFYTAVLLAIPLRDRHVTSTFVILAICVSMIIPIQMFFDASQYLDRIIYLPFLIFGRCLYFLRKNPSWKWTVISAICIATFFGLHIMRFGTTLWTDSYPPITTYAIAIIAFITCMYAPIKRTPQPFRWLADISYSAYLIHLPAGSVLLGALTHFGFPFYSAFFIAVAICLGLSTITFKTIERPMQNFGRSLTTGMRDKSSAGGADGRLPR
ncbi:acyltransferase family protein [Pseudomonas parasichuanensis]|uniref:acyltransferase family protein n=1 Tax=Pseudomonas parasichuanensis TaxID=2892329 RepID=UPI001F416F12|nr:acyltransferase [Pseudomonas parasichuanensis]